MQSCRICFLSKWRYNLNNDKEETWRQYLELSKLYTATVETSALSMIETGLFNQKTVKLKKKKNAEKKLLFLVYIFNCSIKSVVLFN